MALSFNFLSFEQSLLCSGTEVLINFLEDVEAELPGQISTVDIGGGLSTSYTEASEPEQFSYQVYRSHLQEKVLLNILFLIKKTMFLKFLILIKNERFRYCFLASTGL